MKIRHSLSTLSIDIAINGNLKTKYDKRATWKPGNGKALCKRHVTHRLVGVEGMRENQGFEISNPFLFQEKVSLTNIHQ